jgi:hypothetical protein
MSFLGCASPLCPILCPPKNASASSTFSAEGWTYREDIAMELCPASAQVSKHHSLTHPSCCQVLREIKLCLRLVPQTQDASLQVCDGDMRNVAIGLDARQSWPAWPQPHRVNWQLFRWLRQLRESWGPLAAPSIVHRPQCQRCSRRLFPNRGCRGTCHRE